MEIRVGQPALPAVGGGGSPDLPPPGSAWKVDGQGNYILDGEGNKIAIAT
jgi:hypothetical protein